MDKQGQIRAQWCFDSASGREYLIDLDACKVIAEKVNGRLVDPAFMTPPENPDAI